MAVANRLVEYVKRYFDGSVGSAKVQVRVAYCPCKDIRFLRASNVNSPLRLLPAIIKNDSLVEGERNQRVLFIDCKVKNSWLWLFPAVSW